MTFWLKHHPFFLHLSCFR